MPSKRRRTDQPRGHPRNKYSERAPDFRQLASLYPSFRPFVFYSNGKPRIDWTDFNATRELTRVLLVHDHGIHWYLQNPRRIALDVSSFAYFSIACLLGCISCPIPSQEATLRISLSRRWIPDGQLCPTVPNRSNYIHWIEDLLSSEVIVKPDAGEGVRGFDIGTGANCIYPLIGASLYGWSFVGSDFTDALEWAKWNVANNPHITALIEVRNALESGEGSQSANLSLIKEEAQIGNSGSDEVVFSSEGNVGDRLNDVVVGNRKTEVNVSVGQGEDAALPSSCSSDQASSASDVKYYGPPILVGVVRDGEKFDFCMCNPPFFESMEEAGANPRTSCGGTSEEMVCPGGELAFISRIIEDSIKLKDSFRWFTSMVGRKVNLKILVSKLWKVGVSTVQTTEFVQGQTFRWGLAWSFVSLSNRIPASKLPDRTCQSFVLEGLQRQLGAVQVLQSVEVFYGECGASSKANLSSFCVDVTASSEHCEALLGKSCKRGADNVEANKLDGSGV
ncbi:Ribosomal RNA large subunit methyltransferase F [Nymphaea thermarum]|nr:Ribosomal RNA large subunit methyltransferase F [Nymphaea thermarum]